MALHNISYIQPLQRCYIQPQNLPGQESKAQDQQYTAHDNGCYIGTAIHQQPRLLGILIKNSKGHGRHTLKRDQHTGRSAYQHRTRDHEAAPTVVYVIAHYLGDAGDQGEAQHHAGHHIGGQRTQNGHGRPPYQHEQHRPSVQSLAGQRPPHNDLACAAAGKSTRQQEGIEELQKACAAKACRQQLRRSLIPAERECKKRQAGRDDHTLSGYDQDQPANKRTQHLQADRRHRGPCRANVTKYEHHQQSCYGRDMFFHMYRLSLFLILTPRLRRRKIPFFDNGPTSHFLPSSRGASAPLCGRRTPHR